MKKAVACLIIMLLLPALAGASTGKLPAWLLEVPASVHEVLIADADSATLHRFENNGHGIVAKDTRYMSIGRNGVGKQRAWDRKTPLGIYFITEELDTRRLHEKYGDAAFVLDYPNAWDRFLERTGDGIWLHGVDRGEPNRPPLDTDGCLALPNEEITRIAPYLEPLQTPVIVARNLRWADADAIAQTRLEFRAALEDWRRSVEQGDVMAYLGLYADDFRYRSLDRAEWAAWRSDVFDARGEASLRLDDLLLLADPEEPGLYLARFTQVLRQHDREVVTTKRLYWRRGDGGAWRIVTEDNG